LKVAPKSTIAFPRNSFNLSELIVMIASVESKDEPGN